MGVLKDTFKDEFVWVFISLGKNGAFLPSWKGFLWHRGSFHSSGVGIPFGKTICGVLRVSVVSLGLAYKDKKKVTQKNSSVAVLPGPLPGPAESTFPGCLLQAAWLQGHLVFLPVSLGTPGCLIAQGCSQELLLEHHGLISSAETIDISCSRIPPSRKSLLQRFKIVYSHKKYSF